MVLSLWSLLAALFGLGLAIGVVIAVKLSFTKTRKTLLSLPVVNLTSNVAGRPSVLLSNPIYPS